jgi:hypothetical protein
VNLKPTGAVRLSGKLADGTPFTANTALHADRAFAIYAPIYGKGAAIRGSLRGTVQFPVQPLLVGDAAGALVWFKPANANAARFPGGLTLRRSALLGRYQPPAKGTRLLAFDPQPDNGRIVLDGGGFPVIDQRFTLATNQKVTLSAPNGAQIELKFVSASGLFSGAFVAPASGRRTPFAGAVLQADASGSGYFLGASPTEAGAVEIDKAPNP